VDVPYAIVRDTPSSWDDYRRLAVELGAELPSGLLIHVAGPTSEGVREIEIWRSQQDLERFERDRLRPALARITRLLRDPIVRELVVKHLVQESTDKGARQ
jgi:hypothetical protein